MERKKRLTKTEEQNRQRRAVLNDVLTVRGYDGREKNLSKVFGFGETTALNRYKTPTNLTITEIMRMDLSDDQIIRMVRGQMPEVRPITVYLNGAKIH